MCGVKLIKRHNRHSKKCTYGFRYTKEVDICFASVLHTTDTETGNKDCVSIDFRGFQLVLTRGEAFRLRDQLAGIVSDGFGVKS